MSASAPIIRCVGVDAYRITFAGGRAIEVTEAELRAILGQRFRDASRRELAMGRATHEATGHSAT